MQINLADFPLESSPLPAQGLLSFFSADDDYDVEHVSPVIYQPDTTSVRRTSTFSNDEFARGETYGDTIPHKIDFHFGVDVRSPEFDDYYHELLDSSDEKNVLDRFGNFSFDATGLPQIARCIGQVLGYPSSLHGDMRRYAADHQSRESAVDDWRLLWGIGWDHDVGICVGDGGWFYVLIHVDDLHERDFSRTYTELET